MKCWFSFVWSEGWQLLFNECKASWQIQENGEMTGEIQETNIKTVGTWQHKGARLQEWDGDQSTRVQWNRLWDIGLNSTDWQAKYREAFMLMWGYLGTAFSYLLTE